MKTINAANERVKRKYAVYLKEAARRSEQSLDGALKALHRFESYTGFKDFKTYCSAQAVAFKRHLAEQLSEQTGEKLSKATLYSTLADLRKFFHWLAGQPGFKSRFAYSDAEFFNLSDKETAIAKAHRQRPVPTLEQIRAVIAAMPSDTDIELRNRALIAFTILTGARDAAIASMKLKHIDIVEGRVDQDARDVNTKFSKTFPTWFFPVGDDLRAIVVEWVKFLRTQRQWGLDDPLFPATALVQDDDRHFAAAGLKREHWSSAGPIREVFKRAFPLAGLPYFNPHSFRKTLVLLGQQICQSPEQYKAWSQNLGHEHVLTTFTSYGTVAPLRQAEILRQAGEPLGRAANTEAFMQEIARRVADQLGGKMPGANGSGLA